MVMSQKTNCIMLLLSSLSPITALAQDAWTWVQSDWSSAQYQSAHMVDAEIEPGELVLRNDSDRLVFAFDATERAGIWALCQWQDLLYLAACEYPGNFDGGDILVYDYATDTLQDQVYTIYYEDPQRLIDVGTPTVPPAVTWTVTGDTGGKTLRLDYPDGYEGEFLVHLVFDDGELGGDDYFLVTVTA